jgi:hypothetical protein
VCCGSNSDIQGPTNKSIYKWHKSCAETGNVCPKKKDSVRRKSQESVERVRVSFLLLHRNTQGGQGGNWMLSVSYVRD